MKTFFKSLILLAGLSLLLAGCAKENSSTGKGDQAVTFNVTTDTAGTRALADGDGAAASVNRCIMEIYYGDALFTRMYALVENQKCSFTLNMVSNRTYKVVFWADYVESTAGEAIATDLYYTTNADGGLKAISLNGTYAGNMDARDAFFYSQDYTVTQGGNIFSATLKRPFAQVNVITNDLQVIKPAPALKPEEVDVKIKNAYTGFNAVTGEVSNQQDLTYTASLYNFPETIEDKTDATLSMDYLFASAGKEVVDIDWKATKNGNANVAHSFTNIPYQRNYRTNIIGALLTTVGKWDVEVAPDWSVPEIDAKVVGSIASANESLVAGQNNINIVNPDDYANPVVFPAESNGKDISINIAGTSGKKISFKNADGADGPANLFITADTDELDVNTPNSHVEILTGTYSKVTAATSATTLVIGKDVTVNDLNIQAGNAEIFGTVNNITKAQASVITYHIETAAALKNLRDAINARTWVAGKILIDADIDLNNEEWAPIKAYNYPQPTYVIDMDGQNHTIKNLQITGASGVDYIGFFDQANGLTVKNLNFDGANLTYPASAGEGARGGVLVGNVWGINAENVNVKNVTMKACQKLGSLIGYIEGDTNVPNTVKNCSAENVSISSNDPENILQHGSGGFIGHISQCQNPVTTISGCSVKNITIANYNTAPYTKDELQRVPHVFVGSVCQNYDGVETPTISSHSIVFTDNTISGNNTELPTCLYSSEFFGWAGNAEERPAWLGYVYIDGEKWVPDYSVTLSCGSDIVGKYATVCGAVSAYNNATSAGDYTIDVKAGTYEVVNVQINQSTTKALTIQARKEGEVFDDVTLKLTGNETAVFKINGISNYNTLPTVIDHFKFDLSSSTGYSYGIYALNGNDVRYTSNLTVSNCVFLGNEADENGYHCKAGASDSNSSPSNISFINCTAEKMFSLWTGYLANDNNGKGITVKDCTISNSNYFVCETSGDGTIDIDNCDVTVDGAGTRAYAVRYGGNKVDVGGVNINVTNSKFTGGEGYCLFVCWTKSSSPVSLYVDEYTANNVKNADDTKSRLSDVLNRQTGATDSQFKVYINGALKTTLAGTSSSSGDDCNKAFFSSMEI